ncbi:hypothetical protein WBU98_09145 [Bacillus albus]|nr:hypothetical protein [Bacillus albus]WJE70345.1 hypothetical protein QRY64_27050 [Bacillus albus]
MSQTNMSMIYSSEIEFFQSVAAAIEQKDPTIIVNKDSNTHWKNWMEFDCD